MSDEILVRSTREEDIPSIIDVSTEIYRGAQLWTTRELRSHLELFPEGQFVAVERDSARVVGMSASLIVLWDDYEIDESWRDFTDHGMFTNHDPENGRTLYGAETMVRPSMHGRGIGSLLYSARENLVRRLGLDRIRAGARLAGYYLYADRMSPQEYVREVVAGEIGDPTLSFQLRHGFEVLAVVSDYLRDDPESKGYAAVVEWLNRGESNPTAPQSP